MYSKALAPIWNDLERKFKGDENVTIVKMDSTANEIDLPSVNIRGFPTMLLFKGDNKVIHI